LTGTKVVIWWHGVDCRNRINNDFSIPLVSKIFAKLSAGMLLYTEKEKRVWDKYINPKKVYSLNNSIDTKPIVKQYLNNKAFKQQYKEKHRITQANIFIYCARFSSPYRRIDMMIELIETLETDKYGFIIIGDGEYKPDFTKYTNVYDYKAVYDNELKKELFIIADLYFQPGWIGLSIVEAMAYALPVLTLKRSKTTKQGTEYGYLEHNYNAYLAKDINDIYTFVEMYYNDIQFQNKLKKNTLDYVEKNLNVEKMIDNFRTGLLNIYKC
jgi:glycosyltransferase involved in cell wall biosynthesis